MYVSDGKSLLEGLGGDAEGDAVLQQEEMDTSTFGLVDQSS